MKEGEIIMYDKLKMIIAMSIFGTIGLFVKYIPLPSSVIAMVRGFIGTLFIFSFVKIRKIHISKENIKRNLLLLIVSGGFIGANWILLFESYKYTTVAMATLCYYLAPVFVMIAAPFVLKERMTIKKLCCIVVAFGGMILVSGVIGGDMGANSITGMALGCGAAILYAAVVLMNRFIKDISAYDKTMVQLGAATVVVVPYVLLTVKQSDVVLTPITVGLLLFVGIVHTGFAYTLYFGSMGGLKTQTIALFSYLDPIIAIVASVIILQEKATLTTIIGAILILGSTMVSEISFKKEEKS